MMKNHWNEIQPVDHYTVCTNGLLQEFERKIITFLYQPLIGPVSYSLYMSLWGEVEESRLWSAPSNHYHLMNILSMNLQEIHEARMKLEGIGLLKTYAKKGEGERSFIYELQPPLLPNDFFTDGMLNVYLFRKIGRSHYLRLKESFTDRGMEADSFTDVTRSFQDVFSSENSIDFLRHEANDGSLTNEAKAYIGYGKNDGPPLDDIDFDFSLLLNGLSESMVPRRAFTPLVKETILKLSYLYGIGPLQMKNILLGSLDSDEAIDVEQLRKSARDWYQLQTGDELPDLTPKAKPVNKEASKPLTREEELLEYLESTSPKDVLADISNGSAASKSDLQVVEEIVMTQKLPLPVINVLIQYVLLKTDMKLTKGYMEKIASHWARKKVTTAGEAMELAKNEHKQYMEWASGKNEKRTTRRKPIRTEKLPDWFQEDEKVEAKSQNGETYDLEAEKRKLEEELKNFRK
ncbi:replication initiation and membrane attachment family protein [Rossellomorea marisflavi]|uniref:replication initiation and membrane attachment family protein n=1 Tax=Rossellomorea marisflavi TaxID=189381 RepID=UPI003F9F8485